MTGWGGRGAGRISAAVVVVIGFVLAGGGAASARPAPASQVGLPPVTTPPISVPTLTLPPVTLPPVTVPPLPTDDLPPTVGQVIDGAGDTVNGLLGEITGPAPDPGGTEVPPVVDPTDPGTDPGGTGGGGGGGAIGGPSGTGASAAVADGGGRGPDGERARERAEARAARRLDRLAGSGTALAASDLPTAPEDPLDDAVRRDARRFGWPLVLGVFIVLFLAFQHRADRHERKLADAPLDQGERLRFR